MSHDDPDIDWLREAFAQRPAVDAESAAVPPAQIWDAVHGDADAKQVEALAQRMAEDPELAEQWRLAVAARGDMEREESTASAPRKTSPVVWLGVVAAAALALIVARSASSPEPTPSDTYRGAEAAEAWGVDPATPIRDRTLRWNAIQGASSYRVVLFDGQLKPLHESEALSDPHYRVPSEFKGSVSWQVEATLGPNTIERSPTFTAELP